MKNKFNSKQSSNTFDPPLFLGAGFLVSDNKNQHNLGNSLPRKAFIKNEEIPVHILIPN